jgi:hypothetical protein
MENEKKNWREGDCESEKKKRKRTMLGVPALPRKM